MKLIDASLALYRADPITDLPAFKAAWDQFCEACAQHLALPDVTANDPGAFSRDARPTSIKAAFSLPDRGSLRGRMLKLFAIRPNHGWKTDWTDFELAEHFERDPRTVGSCRRDLVLAGWIEEEGSFRFRPEDHEKKRPCTVWVMTSAGRIRYEELYANE